MQKKELAHELGMLMLMDFDLAHAFEEAIETVREEDIRTQFTRFRKDHQEHVFKLSRSIQELGEESPPHSTDPAVFSSGRIISPKNAPATRAVFETMYANEKVAGRSYARAIALQDLPPATLLLLKEHFADEERHFAYIEAALSLSPLPT
jgi:bacterioferritin (cytochrome b1)